MAQNSNVPPITVLILFAASERKIAERIVSWLKSMEIDASASMLDHTDRFQQAAELAKPGNRRIVIGVLLKNGVLSAVKWLLHDRVAETPLLSVIFFQLAGDEPRLPLPAVIHEAHSTAQEVKLIVELAAQLKLSPQTTHSLAV